MNGPNDGRAAALDALLRCDPRLLSNQGRLDVPAGYQLAVTVDTLVCDVHFTLAAAADSVGHKSLAVNLSDLAAMGAEPRAATLMLSLPPSLPARWLEGFGAGFSTLAARAGVALIATQVRSGPLSVCIQAFGIVPEGAALLRGGARPGDVIMVSGTLGDAALALRLRCEADPGDPAAAFVAARLHRPEPRLALGIALRGLAHAGIDVSDGLLADLGHVLARSACGATLRLQDLPLSAAALSLADRDTVSECALRGGDDYELCFTVPQGAEDEARRRARGAGVEVHAIGVIEALPGLRGLGPHGEVQGLTVSGWDHFRW